ncbi:MAG: HlyD family efflux transporter periplasmic adaptor subunit [Chloroflexota bacterium]
MRLRLLTIALCLSLIATLSGCERLPGETLATPTPIPTVTAPLKAVHSVERGDLIESVTLLGIVDSQRRVNLSFRISGRLNGFHAHPGDLVESGQLLAELDVGFLPNELAKAQKQLEMAKLRLTSATRSDSLALAEAESMVKLAKLELENARAGLADGTTDRVKAEFDVAREEIAVELSETRLTLLTEQQETEKRLLEAEIDIMALDVELLQAKIEQARLLTPFRGVVRYTEGEAGQMIAEYEPVMGLADPNALEIRSSTPSEEVLPKLRVGQSATIVFRDAPEQEFIGKLVQVSTPIGADNPDDVRPIRIEFPAPDLIVPALSLEIGSFADITIVVEQKENVLTIPNNTIHNYFNRRYVLVQDGELTAEVDVTLGVTDGERTEVLAGLEEGEQVFER